MSPKKERVYAVHFKTKTLSEGTKSDNTNSSRDKGLSKNETHSYLRYKPWAAVRGVFRIFPA
jgi:hypothetical protein